MSLAFRTLEAADNPADMTLTHLTGRLRLLPALLLLLPVVSLRPVDPAPRRLEILFLGHESRHHESEKLASILLKEYFKAGINISYTTDPAVLDEAALAPYDGLVLYANHDSITPSQSKALRSFVHSGKGFIPLHCASWCFRNDPEVVALIGGQFKSHGYDSFPSAIARPGHPVMKGLADFWTKDETYVHDRLSPDIEVLMERVEGGRREPYTWVRNHGKGRVFYTAYGHDENSFRNPGFLDLVRNGILWAVGEEAVARLRAYPIAAPKYFDGPVPNYEKRDPAPRVQESLSPQQSQSLMQVPAGFDLKLFAAEPMVVNPIYINWDERGRCWVIETVDYPNEIREDDRGDDRIRILEDTDGDGRADKSTLFADSLNIPTSFTFVNGGVMVSCAPSFLFLKDTDGDDRADVKRELLKGWGKWDTHAQASNLRYGPDNRIWGVVGYSGFKGKVGADSLKFAQGLYRFAPHGSDLEFLGTTSNNTWGLGFSEEYDVFISTANNTHTAYYGGIPKRHLDRAGIRQSGVKKLDDHYNMRVATQNLRQVDVFGGFTAAAGHSLYTARRFPREYWNRVAFVTEPTGRLVHRVRLEPQGAGFRERGDGWNLLVSADEWAGPIQAEVGPDGAVWVTDWYDFIIQHNPTPTLERAGLQAVNGAGNAYVNPLRDHERGRIWRIVPKGDGDAHTRSLAGKGPADWVAALSEPNMFWRTTAQRLLVERGDASVMPALLRLVDDRSLDAIGLNAPAIHALWTMHGLGAFRRGDSAALSAARRALSHPAAGVRRTAVQVLPPTPALTADLQRAGITRDPDLRVRLAALVAMAGMPPSAGISALLTAMMADDANLRDEWVRQALLAAGRIHRSGLSAALSAPAPRTADTLAARLRKELRDAIREGYEVGSATGPVSDIRPDRTITLRVVKDVMKYDRTLLTAKAGSLLRIDFQNPDFMQHNLLILKPGTLDKVGEAADRLAQDPNGTRQQYVPRMPEVIAATPLVNPQGSYTLVFRLPAVPGDYPFVCTFPGHWRMMNGILRATK
jgi:putative membrane-bound dehydrogenase-like protein